MATASLVLTSLLTVSPSRTASASDSARLAGGPATPGCPFSGTPLTSRPDPPAGVIADADYGPSIQKIATANNWGSSFNPLVLSDSSIQGLYLQIPWSTIEPANGQYNWAPIDCVLSKADASGKFFDLDILSGFNTPSWLLQYLAYTGAKNPPGATNPDGVPWHWFSYAYPGPDGTVNPLSSVPRALPVPWNSQYLDSFVTFLKVVAARYGTNHEFETIGVSGPTSVSTEMSLPDNATGDGSLPPPGDDLAEFAQKPPNGLGYTPALYEAAWAKMFASFHTLFPNQYMSLALHNVLPLDAQGDVEASAAISTELTVLRSAVAQYPTSLLVQANGLGATSGSNTGPFPYVVGSCSQVTTGFQTHNAAKEKDFARALHHGVLAAVHYIEIYQDGDLLDSSQLNLNEANASAIATTSKELIAHTVSCDPLSMTILSTSPSSEASTLSSTLTAAVAPALAPEVTINIFRGSHRLSPKCVNVTSGLDSRTTCTVAVADASKLPYGADVGAPGVVPNTALAFESVSIASGATKSTPIKPGCMPGFPSNCM
jgi:hypothetical protein